MEFKQSFMALKGVLLRTPCWEEKFVLIKVRIILQCIGTQRGAQGNSSTSSDKHILEVAFNFSNVFKYVTPGITLTGAGDSSSFQNSSLVLILEASFSSRGSETRAPEGAPTCSHQGSSACPRGLCYSKPSPALAAS